MNEYEIDGYKRITEIIYKQKIEPIEIDLKRISRQMGLDDIIDVNNIKPNKYIIKSDLEARGGFDPSNKIIYINMKLLNDYLESLDGQIGFYYTFFHEYIHLFRWQIYESVNNSYRKDVEDRFIEELVTEAITILFLSKKFGKEKIKDIAKEIIVSGWGKTISRYSDGKHLFYLFFGNKNMLPYNLGTILGYLLLDIDADKQKEYVKSLLETYTGDDLRALLYYLYKDIPKNKQTISYYNLIKDIIEGKPIKYLPEND